MPETIGVGRCKGCGSALPEREPGKSGRSRLWCTDNCRKRTHEREVEERAVCRDCWATLGIASARKGAQRCHPCDYAQRRAEHERLLALVERMYNEGRPVREIAGEMGWADASKHLVELRKRGRIGYRYKAYEGRAA